MSVYWAGFGARFGLSYRVTVVTEGWARLFVPVLPCYRSSGKILGYLGRLLGSGLGLAGNGYRRG
jgi:hypothetical protein